MSAHTSGTAAPPRPRAGLGQLLRRQHPQREAGVHDPAGKLVRGANPALDDFAEADLPGEHHTLIEGVEGAAVVEVWSVHTVPGSTQCIGEGEEPRRLTVCVVEQQDLSHLLPCPFVCGRP